MNKSAQRYHESLKNIPPPGTGCHPYLLSVANHGVWAGEKPKAIFDAIQKSIPQGARWVPPGEIWDAVNKAQADHTNGTFTPHPRPKPSVQDGKSALQKIISAGKIGNVADLYESSPLRLSDEPQNDPVLLLSTLFKPGDFVWIGDRHEPGVIGSTIRTAGEWIAHFEKGGKTGPHIIINPLTGRPATKKSGGETLRGDRNVAEFRYCLIEFDTLNPEDQIRFFSGADLPAVTLIDSAGRSIHAWIDVSKIAKVSTEEEWQTQIRGRLYERLLQLLGVDMTGSNPSRLSRLPGHYRTEKSGYQKILWLSREGRRIF